MMIVGDISLSLNLRCGIFDRVLSMKQFEIKILENFIWRSDTYKLRLPIHINQRRFIGSHEGVATLIQYDYVTIFES